MQKYKKLLLYSTIALGLLVTPAVGITYHNNVTNQPTTVLAKSKHHVHYSKLVRNVHKLARQRRKYHHPSISWNFRDIGGFDAMNGKDKVKPDYLFLSSYIGDIHSSGAKKIKQLHVHTDLDMRNYRWTRTSIENHPQPGEFGLRKDPRHLDLRYIYLPVETSYTGKHDWVPNEAWYNKYGETIKFRNVYTTNYQARKVYRQSLYDIMKYTKNGNAIMFNCNSGRDRSATLAMIILSMLGVDHYDVYNNYLLTNYNHYQTPYTTQLKRAKTFYSTVNRKYGSFNNYLRKGLHLSPQFIKSFRNRFLVKN